MDMNQCMVGDKLLLRNGSVGTFNGLGCTGICDVRYPYTMIYNGSVYSVTKDGLVYTDELNPKDVIGFATVNTKLNKYRHFYLYAKQFYKSSNTIEDLQKLVANYTNSKDPQKISITDIMYVLEDAVNELLEGKLNTHAKILRAIHKKSKPLSKHTTFSTEEILINAYLFILLNAEGKEIPKWSNETQWECIGQPDPNLLPIK